MLKDLTLHNRDQQVIQAIAANNADLDPAARDKKLGAMSESAYRFFRGTSHLFWQDMYHDWRFALFGGVAGTHTWIQGDDHVYNFGVFANQDVKQLTGEREKEFKTLVGAIATHYAEGVERDYQTFF